MTKFAKRLKALLAGSGPVLFLLRLPFRVIKTVADLGVTRFYGVFLGSMGVGCHIEFGARIESPRYVFLGRDVKIGKGTLIVSEFPNGYLQLSCFGLTNAFIFNLILILVLLAPVHFLYWVYERRQAQQQRLRDYTAQMQHAITR